MLNLTQQCMGSSKACSGRATGSRVHYQHHARSCRKPSAGQAAVQSSDSSLESVDTQSVDVDQQRSAAVQQAYQSGTLAFGFSAGGLLFPYYLGVAEQLQSMNILQQDTQLAGASAGSLIVACIKSGLPLTDIQAACFQLADDCRRNGTRHRLGPVLEGVLREVLPSDVHQRCTDQIHVAVTKLAPKVQNRLVSRFRNREDLIQALLTSCHIPWYFDGSLFTKFRKTPCFDGGFTNFLPDVPGAYTCRICCLPSKQLARIGNIAIAPDAFVAWPYTIQQMLQWAFEPADEEQLLALIQCGRRDALAWAQQEGLDQLAASTAVLNNNGSKGTAAPVIVLPSGRGSSSTSSSSAGQQAPAGRSRVFELLGGFVQRK